MFTAESSCLVCICYSRGVAGELSGVSERCGQLQAVTCSVARVMLFEHDPDVGRTCSLALSAGLIEPSWTLITIQLPTTVDPASRY